MVLIQDGRKQWLDASNLFGYRIIVRIGEEKERSSQGMTLHDGMLPVAEEIYLHGGGTHVSYTGMSSLRRRERRCRLVMEMSYLKEYTFERSDAVSAAGSCGCRSTYPLGFRHPSGDRPTPQGQC